MIDKDLLDILACPQNRMPLRLAEASLLARLNRAIADGCITNQVGRPVEDMLEGGLVRQDGALLYPIAANIPVLLPEEAIPLAQLSQSDGRHG
jgi:uncharacterized protein